MREIELKLFDKLDYYSRIYSDVKFIVFIGSIITILSFLLIYSFLYGYYFSGDVNRLISNFSVISNFIPFDVRTLSMTAFYFICIFYVLLGFISLIKKDRTDKQKSLTSLVVVLIVMTAMLTLFFSSDITFRSFFSFSLIWIFLGLIIWYLFILINILFNPMIAFESGVLILLLLFIIYHFLIETTLERTELKMIVFVLLMILGPIITTLLIVFKNKNWMFFLKILPYTYLVTMIISYFFKLIGIHLGEIFVFIFVFLLNIPMYFLVKYMKRKFEIKILENKKVSKKEVEVEVEVEEEGEGNDLTKEINHEKGIVYNIFLILYKLMADRKENGMKMFVGMIVLLAFVAMPQMSMLCGKGIRTINTSEVSTLKIFYVNQNNTEDYIIANYYIENNSVLYISNEKWQLEVIKPVNYHIVPN